jgi:hypothetical protein
VSLSVLNDELIAAKPVFTTLSPGMPAVFRAEAAGIKYLFKGISAIRTARQWRRGSTVADIIGGRLGGKVINKSTAPVQKRVLKAHLDTQSRAVAKRELATHPVASEIKNGPTPNELKTREWINEPGRTQMVIVFHDAKKAGPHIDVHIGQLSLVYRVKPEVYSQLRYNNKGYLTEASQKLLVDYVKDHVNRGARVAQNLDHTPEDARETWVNGDPMDTTYGAGRTRQIISESAVDVYKAHEDGPVEFYAPAINPHRALYLFKLYDGGEKGAPILVWGNKQHHPPALEDRLHLKMIDSKDLSKLSAKADMKTSTIKYDGASCYVVTGPKGTTVWSPRISARTGEQIEYTMKLDGVGGITAPETMIGMGELLFKEMSACGRRTVRTLSAAEVGGILNSQAVLPERIKPEIRLYRIDKVGRVKTGALGFWENRQLQQRLADQDPEGRLKVVELATPEKAMKLGFEGVVAVPEGAGVNDGYKVKWWQDPSDWRIDAIDFKPGDKGGMAGVIRCTSLESGKTFNLGPGQLGTRELCQSMMDDPDRFIGSVLKVESRHGHEGRAAKVIGFHDDKGLSPF